MQPKEFDGNEQDCSFTYHRTREGPNFFISHYKGTTRGHNDPKDCWRTLGTAKFTDTGKKLKEWCMSMDEQYGEHSVELDMNQVKAEGFGPEAHEKEPTEQTRMVT